MRDMISSRLWLILSWVWLCILKLLWALIMHIWSKKLQLGIIKSSYGRNFPNLFFSELTPRSAVLDKLTVSSLVKKFLVVYGSRMFNTPVTTACHLSLSWKQINPVHASPSHFLKIHFNIILPSISGSTKLSFSIRFPHQLPSRNSPFPHTCYMPRPSYSLDFITWMFVAYTS